MVFLIPARGPPHMSLFTTGAMLFKLAKRNIEGGGLFLWHTREPGLACWVCWPSIESRLLGVSLELQRIKIKIKIKMKINASLQTPQSWLVSSSKCFLVYLEILTEILSSDPRNTWLTSSICQAESPDLEMSCKCMSLHCRGACGPDFWRGFSELLCQALS